MKCTPPQVQKEQAERARKEEEADQAREVRDQARHVRAVCRPPCATRHPSPVQDFGPTVRAPPPSPLARHHRCGGGGGDRTDGGYGPSPNSSAGLGRGPRPGPAGHTSGRTPSRAVTW